MIRSEGLAEQFIWMSKAIHRVRKLHEQVTIDNAACGDPDCCGDYEEWKICEECECEYPCDTIKALEGEQP